MTTTKSPTTKLTRSWTLSIAREELARRIKRKRAPQIAKSLGVSPNTVRDHLKAFDIPSPWKAGRPKGKRSRKRTSLPGKGASLPGKGAKLNITDAELVARINAGETAAEIGAAFGVSKQRVNQRLQASGLEYARHSVKRDISDEDLVAKVAKKTQREVAKELGVNQNTVAKWLQDSGLDYVRHVRSRAVDVTDEEIAARLADGETQVKIATDLDVSHATLSRWLRKSGLDYVRHQKAGPGRPMERGSTTWRRLRAKAAAIYVAEYARSVRAEHDAEEARAERLQAKVADLEGACREARAAILAGRPFDAVSYLDDVLRLGCTEEAPPVEAMPEIEPIMADPIDTVIAGWPHPARALIDTLMAACGYDTTDSAIKPIASVPTTA